MYSCQVYQYYYISYERCDSSLGIVIGLQVGMWDQGSILSRGQRFVPSLKHSVTLGPSQPPGCQRLLSWVLSSTWVNMTGHFHTFTPSYAFITWHLVLWLFKKKILLRTCPNVTMQLKWYHSSPKAHHKCTQAQHFNHIHKMFIIYNLCFRHVSKSVYACRHKYV